MHHILDLDCHMVTFDSYKLVKQFLRLANHCDSTFEAVMLGQDLLDLIVKGSRKLDKVSKILITLIDQRFRVLHEFIIDLLRLE